MTSEKGCRKEKNQNIQVSVRLRPLNQRERDIKSLGVVEVNNDHEVIIRHSQPSTYTKKFTFDRAFPPHSKQVEVYQEVVSPLIEEVLAGYNCTVFAYGQTGTGKTHTMVGEAPSEESTWQADHLAGIIPRALSQLFDELRVSNTEYTVRVSYLELYNEELFDLLSTSEDNSKLRIYEDVSRKGSNIVNGLEEITVHNKNEVYKILARGQERKRVASTLMNSQSSRSHTVFTIVVHMKENMSEGEEMVKIGKLNLVDLAGSENISKAGSDNPAKKERARECVNINQSLLTLGRVITALVERHPHIPYRESKLTRILQESLGGRTKTSIIATISPGHKDLEETMSTLEYANRAKNIQNKPEVNQKMTKKAILRDYVEEIDRLKRELYAAREKNGVYLPSETFTEMTLKHEEQRKEIQELLLKKRAMEEERDRLEGVFKELNFRLEEKETCLADTTNRLTTSRLHCEEQKHLVSQQAQTEAALSTQAREVLAAADAASCDAQKLHDSVDKRRSLESTNLEITKAYREVSAQHKNNILTGSDNMMASLTQAIRDLQTSLESHTEDNITTYNGHKQKLDRLVQQAVDTVNKMTSLKTTGQADTSAAAVNLSTQLQKTLENKMAEMQDTLDTFAASTVTSLQRAQHIDMASSVTEYLEQWQKKTAANVTSLRNTHPAFETSVRNAAGGLLGAAQRHRADRETVHQKRERDIMATIASVLENTKKTKQCLDEKLLLITNEKVDFEERYSKWAETERRLLEERIQLHVTSERNILEERMQKQLEDIERQRVQIEKRTSDDIDWLNNMLRLTKEEIEKEKNGDDLKEYENVLEKCILSVQSLAGQCETECTEISSSIDVVKTDAVSVADRVQQALVAELQRTQEQIQSEASTSKTNHQQSVRALTDATSSMVDSMARSCQRTLDTIGAEITGTTTSTIAELSSLSADTATLAASSLSHQNSQHHALMTTHRQVEQYYGRLREEMAKLEDLETRCLNQEYLVYNPSGDTPVRKEYRYPRAFAATSPHERILARFRAMRQSSNDDDCMVIENEVESRSDESSASEDSSAIFAAPSPLTNHSHSDHNMPIVKCTSETDIYTKRRQNYQQGKENSNHKLSRSTSFKKPSKLPAPSHKKPLNDKND